MSVKTYVPLNPCKNCGTSLRYKSNYGCCECLKFSNRKYQEENREVLLKKKLQWAKDNPEKNREQSRRWQKENPEKYKTLNYQTKKRNWGTVLTVGRIARAKRRAALINRTPSWSNKSDIRKIYEECPTGYEVDHVIPLQGKFVSGLHVANNLQYLTKSDNSAKSNFYE